MTHVHFIGIGGSGLSAIARLLLENGYTVSGSDRLMSPLARDLAAAGVQVTIGHAPANIAGADVVVRSSAVPDDNPEVIAARAAGIAVLKRAEFLGQYIADKRGVAVAGTHGKTTTTAMIAWMLRQLGQDPSYIIGGVSKDLGGNAHAGRGEAFVIEADEYDRMFLGLHPEIAVVTNLEHDHPDCYPTPADYHAAFAAFVQGMKPGGLLLACADDLGAASLLVEPLACCRSLSYGLSSTAHYRAANLARNERGGLQFNALREEAPLVAVSLRVPGEHNVRNALAALAVADAFGLSLADAAAALGEFTGTGRRFDLQGEAWGVDVIDHYAHHPTEIRATLAAARSRYPGRRIWAVWQPHTYSRTQTLLADFTSAFGNADRVIVTEIYAAREQNPGFSAAVVAAQIQPTPAHFSPTLEEAGNYLLSNLQPGDVLLVLSAGDADQISARVLVELKHREQGHA